MKTYALTGSASGIGAGIKQQLLAEGHKVITIDISNADIVTDLGNHGGGGRSAAIQAVSTTATDGIDGFIACAGVSSHIDNLALIPSANYFGAVVLVEDQTIIGTP